MTSRERPYPPDEPVIGLNYPGYDDEPESYDNGFDDSGDYIGAPPADGYEQEVEGEAWADEYDEPYDDYYYDDEYYDTQPARQPLFYVIIGLAVVLGALLVFLVFQLLNGNGTPATVSPDFNIAIDQPLQNERVNVDTDIDVRVRANSTERIVMLQLRVDGDLIDEESFDEAPEDGVYRATLQFRITEPGNYSLVARAVSQSGATEDSEPIMIIAVEAIDERPASVLGEIITSVNARLGPGDEYEAVRTLSAGETVTVVGRTRDNQWLLLDDDTWVRRAAVQLSESLDLVEVRQPTPTPAVTATAEPDETPTPTPVANAPDFTPTNATLDGGGSILRVTVANLSGTGYEGPLVVRVSGLARGTFEQVFGVNIGGNASSTVEFVLTPAHTDGATVQITVDPDGAITELSEDNNSASFVLAAPVEPADLVISNVQVQGSTISVTVRNDGGPLSSSQLTVQVALGDVTNQASGTVALARGQSHSFNVSTPPGSGTATVRLLVGTQQVAATNVELTGEGVATPTPDGD